SAPLRALTSKSQNLQAFRRDFSSRVLLEWRQQPVQPARAVFMLDAARIFVESNYRYWLEFVDDGRRYLTDRAEPIGANPALDQFEIAWHKASAALLGGMRRPDYLFDCGLNPLRDRMSAAQVDGHSPQLIDPWIELARGYVYEDFGRADRSAMQSRGAM